MSRERAFAVSEYGIGDEPSVRLIPVAPLSGDVLRGASLKLPGYAVGPTFSPGRRLAGFGAGDEVLLVDLGRMQLVRRIRVPDLYRGVVGLSAAEVLAWQTGRRLIVLTGPEEGKYPLPKALQVVDAVTGRRRPRVPVRLVLDVEIGPSGEVVLLSGPQVGIGPVRLFRVDARGRVGSVEVSRVTSGLSSHPDLRRHPDLAVDYRRGRAFVIGPDEPVAEVSLRSLHVRYHGLPRRGLGRGTAPLAGPRPFGTLPPVPEHDRRAEWVEPRFIAVSGHDSVVRRGQRDRPAGLKLIDVRSWTVRTVDPRAAGFYVIGDTLLVTHYSPRNGRTTGLVAYGRGGSKRFELRSARYTLQWWPRQGRLYVRRYGAAAGPEHVELRDPRNGAVLRRFVAGEYFTEMFTWRP